MCKIGVETVKQFSVYVLLFLIVLQFINDDRK